MRLRFHDQTSAPDKSRTTSYVSIAPSTSVTMGPRVGSRKRMLDVVTPKFKRLSNKGKIINSPMSQYNETFGSSLSGYRHHYQGDITKLASGVAIDDNFDSLLNWKLGPLPTGHEKQPYGWPGTQLISDSAISALETQAATQVLAEAQASSVQSLVFIMEFEKTLRTMINPLQATRQLLSKGFARGFTVRDVGKGVSSQYLTWFYGIRSLMFDIEGCIDALDKTIRERTTFRKRLVATETSVRSNLPLHSGSVLVDSRYAITQTDTFTVSTGCLVETEGVGYTKAFGVRLSDIPLAVWEVIPWSFVIDWFVNVGDYIAATMFDISTGSKAQWLTHTYTTLYERQVTSCTVSDGWAITKACADRDFGVYTTKHRNPANLGSLTGLTLSGNLDKVPVFAALALVVQQLTKRG